MNHIFDNSRVASDANIATDREEAKHLVPLESVGTLITELDGLWRHQTNQGPTQLLTADYFVTTIYFDTASGLHYRAAIADFEHSIKVRARAYFDVGHASIRPATNDLWLELKRREGTRTFKQRALLAKREILEVVNGCQRADNVLPLLAHTEARKSSSAQIAAYCRDLCEPLTASSVVNYRRLSFQTPDAQVRITLDLSLSYFAPPLDLWQRNRPLLASALGTARGFAQYCVLEVKSHGPLPIWCSALLQQHALRPTRFCKFLAAEQAIRSRR